MSEETLFELALGAPDDERAGLLDRECAGNPALRSRVEALLAAHFASGSPLDMLAGAPANDTRSFDHPGATATYRTAPGAAGPVVAGRYKLLEPIGEGGMGTVWMAEQIEPVKRRVAVKLIRADRVQSKTILSRFEAERQAIAVMDHPHIARLLDAGTAEDGSPYFVMELVKGVPLNEFCYAHKLSVPDRLNLFVQLCSAVQHAHQKGVIHRDLKPSNVLVESHDGKPVPKVIDFGLAKATTGMRLTEHTLFTGFGSVMGTPLYMAPEQATFNAVDVDTRADVYALGVILYELLTGTTPLTRDTVKRAALDEMLRMIREQDAPTPSSRLSTSESKPAVAANRQTEPAKLGRFVRGELDWIVLKALSKNRDRRYDSATGFARDVERFLNHEPVAAGPPSVAYKLRKFVQRNKGPVIAGSVVLLALLLGLVGTTLGLLEARRQKADAVQAREDERAQRTIADQNAARAARERMAAVQALRDSTDDVMTNLIGSREELGPDERAFLARSLVRWERVAASFGDGEDPDGVRSEGLFRVSLIRSQLNDLEAAAAGFRKVIAMREKLVATDPHPNYRQGLGSAHYQLARVLGRLGHGDEARAHDREALRVTDGLATEFPQVPGYHEQVVGSLLAVAPHLPKADRLEHYRRAVRTADRLVTEFPRDRDHDQHRYLLAFAQVREALCLLEAGDKAGAEELWQRAVRRYEGLVAERPHKPEYRKQLAISHHNLAIQYGRFGEWAKAEDAFRRGLVVRTRLAADYPVIPAYRRELGVAHHDFGGHLRLLGRFDAAEEQQRAAVAVFDKLAREFPGVADYRSLAVWGRGQLGSLLAERGQWEEGESVLREAVADATALVREFPDAESYKRDAAACKNNYGLNLVKRGRRAEALPLHREALALLAALVDRHKDYPDLLALQGETYRLLAHAEPDIDSKTMAEHLDKAVAILERAVGLAPALYEPRHDLAQAHTDRATLALRSRDHPRVIEASSKAIDTLTPLLDRYAGHPPTRRALSEAYSKRAATYRRLQQFAEAITDWNKAVEFAPATKRPVWQAMRASSYVRNGQTAEAVADVATALKHPDLDPNSVYNCACVLALVSEKEPTKREEYAGRAVALLRRAGQADPARLSAAKTDTDFDPVRDRADFKKLLAEVEKASPKREPPPTPKKEKE